MKKPTNFSLLLLCLSFYAVDRQPTTKERKILSSSLFLPFTDERTTRRRSHEGKRETAFRTKPPSFIIILLLKFVRAQKSVRGFYFAHCVVRCCSQRSPPFLSSSSNVMMRKKEVYTRASWKNKNIILYTFRTSLGDDLVVVVWINVHGRHIWWESSDRCESPIRLSRLCRKFLLRPFSLWSV